jgi:hypothetical protein
MKDLINRISDLMSRAGFTLIGGEEISRLM